MAFYVLLFGEKVSHRDLWVAEFMSELRTFPRDKSPRRPLGAIIDYKLTGYRPSGPAA